MTIQKMMEEERTMVLNYLLPYEKFCVLLFSQIQQKSPSVYLIKGNFGEIHGVFSWWKGSAIHHCIPDVYGKNRTEIESAFTEFFYDMTVDYIFSIAGEKAGCQLISKVLHDTFFKRPKVVIQNKLMENKRYDSKKDLTGMNQQLEFSVCKEEEFEKILPMQLAYEKEEIEIPGHEIEEESCRAKLENYVEASAVHLGKIKNVPLCKATVTSSGKNWILLGGVYVLPKYRKHGLGKALIEYMEKTAQASGKKITLFVKNDNIPAKKLYESCGFKSFCDYQILYY